MKRRSKRIVSIQRAAGRCEAAERFFELVLEFFLREPYEIWKVAESGWRRYAHDKMHRAFLIL